MPGKGMWADAAVGKRQSARVSADEKIALCNADEEGNANHRNHSASTADSIAAGRPIRKQTEPNAHQMQKSSGNDEAHYIGKRIRRLRKLRSMRICSRASEGRAAPAIGALL